MVLLSLLLGTALTLRVRARAFHTETGIPLTLLPPFLNGLHAEDMPLSSETLQTLGDGEFLNRRYSADDPSYSALPVDLLIAYFPSQRNGQSIHSPQNCLPGAGWTFQSSSPLNFVDESGSSHRVGEYLLSNGDAMLEVLYWYRSRGQDIANDYLAKADLMVEAIRDGRTDGALIRISTPVLRGESQSQARSRVVRFAAHLEPLLPAFLPR